VARFLSLTEGFAFDPVSETPDVSDASRQSELDEDLLDEAGLLSLSIWRTTSGEPTLEVQVYETADSRGAYQLYSWWKLAGTQPTASVESLPVGNAVGAGEGLFWRANYMLRVSGPDTAEFVPVFTRFVEAFARTIPLDNFLPVSVNPSSRRRVGSRLGSFLSGSGDSEEEPRLPRRTDRQDRLRTPCRSGLRTLRRQTALPDRLSNRGHGEGVRGTARRRARIRRGPEGFHLEALRHPARPCPGGERPVSVFARGPAVQASGSMASRPASEPDPARADDLLWAPHSNLPGHRISPA
jgi:hypothetical protein